MLVITNMHDLIFSIITNPILFSQYYIVLHLIVASLSCITILYKIIFALISDTWLTIKQYWQLFKELLDAYTCLFHACPFYLFCHANINKILVN